MTKRDESPSSPEEGPPDSPSSVTPLRRIAIQGEAGSYSDIVAQHLGYGPITVLPCRNFDDAFVLLENGSVDSAALPIENTLAGSIHRNYDLMLAHEFHIVRELHLHIQHQLIAHPESNLEDIRRVVSHPVALAQCEQFFQDHPSLERSATDDTSGAVREVWESGSRETAAIASRRSAGVHGMKILRGDISDHTENYTRFFELVKPPEGAKVSDVASDRADKMTAVFAMPNRPASLWKCLSTFALRDVDLTRIESRPYPGRPWQYVFYVDFLGHSADPVVQRALGHLGECTDLLRVLGCYERLGGISETA